ncbi:nucleoside diphosphate kinase regulator [Lutibaculum baratangense]|uniref:Nucleoside diphosphate kinase regulator, Rnk n=1 Tax=Lutibaculum baratangense AMV1 TaxID=631454 RepID=V4TEA9_9HYPH|nr:nucleoside diphosphate kinase regulator [Lutibaculum baratangense]ESR24543.1 nucleoside diphosphate kinase regulator, Rnk [Lutibaculum baratangense AMV1]
MRNLQGLHGEAFGTTSSGTSNDWTYPAEFEALDAVRPLECCLTVKDHGLLEHQMLELAKRPRQSDFLVRLMRAKLADARIVMTADLPPDIASANSRIGFSIEGGPEEQRVLTFWDHEALAHQGLPVTTPLGATLLGMRAGQTGVHIEVDGRQRGLELRRVLFQPEHARRSMRQHCGEYRR